MNSFFFWVTTAGSTVLAIFGIRLDEQPQFKSLYKQGSIEVREYQGYIAASVDYNSDDKDSTAQAFNTLASYIFGKNKSSEKIKMTAPVTVDQSELIKMTAPVQITKGGRGSMTFMMPSKYTLETLPKPEDSRIRIEPRPAETVAVLRFSGSFRDEKFKEAETRLREWLSQHPEYEIIGEPRWAGYDPPFTIPFLKRNELMIPVRPRAN